MNLFSVSSLLEDLKKVKDYSAMADLRPKTISMLFSQQLRSLPLKGGVRNGRGYIHRGK